MGLRPVWPNTGELPNLGAEPKVGGEPNADAGWLLNAELWPNIGGGDAPNTGCETAGLATVPLLPARMFPNRLGLCTGAVEVVWLKKPSVVEPELANREFASPLDCGLLPPKLNEPNKFDVDADDDDDDGGLPLCGSQILNEPSELSKLPVNGDDGLPNIAELVVATTAAVVVFDVDSASD